MTPDEKNALTIMLRTISTALSNMVNNETDYTRISNLQQLQIAVEFCLDTFEQT